MIENDINVSATPLGAPQVSDVSCSLRACSRAVLSSFGWTDTDTDVCMYAYVCMYV